MRFNNWICFWKSNNNKNITHIFKVFQPKCPRAKHFLVVAFFFINYLCVFIQLFCKHEIHSKWNIRNATYVFAAAAVAVVVVVIAPCFFMSSRLIELYSNFRELFVFYNYNIRSMSNVHSTTIVRRTELLNLVTFRCSKDILTWPINHGFNVL